MATGATGGKRATTRPRAQKGSRPTARSRAAAPRADVESQARGLSGGIADLLRTPQAILGQISGTGRNMQQLASLDVTARTVANVAALVERCNVLLDRLDEEGGVDRLLILLDKLEPMVERGGPLIERAGPLLDRADPILVELQEVPTSVFQIRDWVEDVHHHLVPVLHGLGLDLVRLERIPLAGRIRKRMEKSGRSDAEANADSATAEGARARS